MRMMLITIVIIIIQSYLARSPTPTTGEQLSQETQACNLSATITIVIITIVSLINVSIISVIMITSFMITSVFFINIIIIKIFWCIAKVIIDPKKLQIIELKVITSPIFLSILCSGPACISYVYVVFMQIAFPAFSGQCKY